MFSSFVSATEEDVSNASIGFGHFQKNLSEQPCTSRLSPAERQIVFVQPVDAAQGTVYKKPLCYQRTSIEYFFFQ